MSYNVFPPLSGITWDIKKRPTWNTAKMLTAAGNEFRTGYRQNPLTEFDLSYSYLSPTDKLSMEGFFNNQNGSLTPFYFDLGVATNTASDNSVTAFTFGIGDGTTTVFTLIKSAGTGAVEPIGGVNGTPLIYKSDWQGNQLQYSTPRTNLITNSNNFGAASWTNTNCTITAAATTGPDGTTSGTKLAVANVSNPNITNNDYTVPSPAPASISVSVWLKAGNISQAILNSFQNGVGGVAANWVILSGPGSVSGNGTDQGTVTGLSATQWTRVGFTTTGAFSPTHQFNLYIKPQTGSPTIGDYIYCAFAQMELGTADTSYIATAGSTVTVTDYTLTGNQVAFAVAPLLNAVMTWTGNFYYLVRFSEDVLEFNQLANQMYELQECKLVSVQ